MEKILSAAELFHKRALLYQEKYMDVGLYENSFDRFCEAIPKENPAILDIACGPGNITRYLLKKRPDFKILGIDLAPGMVELARKNNPQAEFRVLDVREISQLFQRYDGIMCGFCFPYLNREEVRQLILDVYDRLEEGGAFYVSTMEADYDKSGVQTSSAGDEVYIYYHQGDELSTMMQETGFFIRELRRQDFPSTDGSKMVDVCILAIK